VRLRLAIVAAVMTVVATGAQSLPSFEVASVKRNTSGSDTRFRPEQTGLSVTYTTLRIAASWAFDVQFFQVLDGPDWADSDRFDIVAKAGGTPSRSDIHMMLRSLLIDRFKLRTHVESREMPVYALVVDRPGTGTPQLKRSDADCASGPSDSCAFSAAWGSIHARGMPVSALMEPLGGVTGRPILDRTGLTDRFDYDLTWTPQALDPGAASFFTAVREQLGLKLEATAAPVDVLIIDAAEKPTPD
jgi:uncharacterized protein (TIGR03435 family)